METPFSHESLRTSGKTEPVWHPSELSLAFTPVVANETADVCVVGAGISGLITAYTLAKQGRRVIVLEDGDVGSGETGRTTAHLSNALDDHYFKIERLHGREGARIAAESHTAAIAYLESIVASEGIDCDFERLDGYLFLAEGDSVDTLEQEQAAANRAGLLGVRLVDDVPWRSFKQGPALLFPHQGQLHAMRFLRGLAEAAVNRGVRIFTQTHVESVADGMPVKVTVRGGFRVEAEDVVVATNSPFTDRVAMHVKQAAYRSYVIAARMPVGVADRALYWDTGDPYHYVRFQRIPGSTEEEWMIVGGEDHKTGQASDAEARYARLEAWTRERFPMLRSIDFQWSGQVLEPADAMAFIGREPGSAHVWLITGDSGNGMTHGPIGGLILSELLQGRPHPWATLYDPSRVSPRAAMEFVRENINAAAQYASWVTPGDVPNPSRIQKCSGAIVRHGKEKIAAYRDASGTLFQCSAVCPHLGGLVEWNEGERTWDCPAHGSRFDAYGEVINGPANTALKRLDADAETDVPQPVRRRL